MVGFRLAFPVQRLLDGCLLFSAGAGFSYGLETHIFIDNNDCVPLYVRKTVAGTKPLNFAHSPAFSNLELAWVTGVGRTSGRRRQRARTRCGTTARAALRSGSRASPHLHGGQETAEAPMFGSFHLRF